MTLQAGLYRTMNDLKLHIPVRYEIKILTTTEMKFMQSYTIWIHRKVQNC